MAREQVGDERDEARNAVAAVRPRSLNARLYRPRDSPFHVGSAQDTGVESSSARAAGVVVNDMITLKNSCYLTVDYQVHLSCNPPLSECRLNQLHLIISEQGRLIQHFKLNILYAGQSYMGKELANFVGNGSPQISVLLSALLNGVSPSM